VGVLAAPVLYLASHQSEQLSWITADREAVLAYPDELFQSHTIAWTMMLVSLFGAVAIGNTHRHLLAPLLAWAFVPPLFCYLTYPLVHLFLAKYALFTMPAWALLCAAAVVVPLAHPPRPLVVYRAVAMPAAVVLALALGWVDQRLARAGTAPGEPDFRGAAAIVDAQSRPGDGIAYAGILRRGRLPFSHELRRPAPRDVFLVTPAAKTGWYAAVECDNPARCLGDTQRLWLVASNGSVPDPFAGMPTARAAYLRQHFTVVETDKLRRVQVLLLVRRPPGV
jgi:mannosyltransferase